MSLFIRAEILEYNTNKQDVSRTHHQLCSLAQMCSGISNDRKMIRITVSEIIVDRCF